MHARCSGRGGAESEASGPKAATLGKCDGQRTKEQRGARSPAHAKVGGATVLAGLACSPLFAVYQTHRAQTAELGALPVTGAEKERARGRGSVARRLPGRALLASE